MSYDSKITQVKDLVSTHNSNVDDSSKVDFEKIMENLRKMGGTSEQALKSVSWEDLQSCGLPVILARTASKIFRQEDGDESGSSSVYVSTKKASMLTPQELIERYNPKDANNSVGKRLNELSNGKAFIVFNDNGKVIVDSSTKLLEDIMNGLPEVDTAFVSGRPYPVFRVGDRFEVYADENPLYPGRPLRSGETCDQTGRSWSGVSMDIRQLLYIAVMQTKELEIDKVANASDIMDKVMSQGCTLDSLRSRYPKASKLYDALSKVGKLPILKIKIELGNSLNNRQNNPFGASKTF